jgi:hypothetical protein
MNLTKQYPFQALSVGNHFIVTERFQHARVAASEFARKHGMVFTCRMQSDGTMHVIRVEANQASVDVRGAKGKRRIPVIVKQPTKAEFMGWLAMFLPGQSFAMPATYTASFDLMSAWVELFAVKTNQLYRAALQPNGTLLIAKGN